MRKLLTLIFLTLTSLFACSGEFVSCSQKAFDAEILSTQVLSLPLEQKQRLVVTTDQQNTNVIAHNPFLGLSLVQDEKNFKYPYTFDAVDDGTLALVTSTKAVKTTLISQQNGLDQFGELDIKQITPALLSDGCCHIEGIVTPLGVISKAYIQHFITHPKVNYADIGVRFVQNGKKIRVSAVDPFYKNNPFALGDTILKFENISYENVAHLQKKILFSTVGNECKVQLLRRGKKLTVTVGFEPRFGGGFVSDTFLERKGLYFNSQGVVNALGSKANGMGVRVGDKLIGINQHTFKNLKDIRLYLLQNSNNLLFERKGFQFNIHLQ